MGVYIALIEVVQMVNIVLMVFLLSGGGDCISWNICVFLRSQFHAGAQRVSRHFCIPTCARVLQSTDPSSGYWKGFRGVLVQSTASTRRNVMSGHASSTDSIEAPTDTGC